MTSFYEILTLAQFPSDASEELARLYQQTQVEETVSTLLSETEKAISERFGEDLARLLLSEIPSRILRGEHV